MVALKSKTERSFLAATMKSLQEVNIEEDSNRKRFDKVPTTIVAKRAMTRRLDNVLTPEFSLGTANSSSHWRKQSGTPNTTSTISSKHSDRDSYITEQIEDKDEQLDHESLGKCSKQLFSSNEHEFDHHDPGSDPIFRRGIDEAGSSTNCHKSGNVGNCQDNVRFFTSPWDFHSPVQLQPDNFHLLRKGSDAAQTKSLVNLKQNNFFHVKDSVCCHQWTGSLSPSNEKTRPDGYCQERNDYSMNNSFPLGRVSQNVQHVYPFWFHENYMHRPFHFHQFQQRYSHPQFQQMYSCVRPISNGMMTPLWNTLTN